MGKDKEIKDLVIKRVFDAPVDKLWNAWTDEEMLKKWWGPFDFYTTIANVNLNSGRKTLLNLTSKKYPEYGTMYSTWEYRNIIFSKRLEFLHNLTDEQGQPLDPTEYDLPQDFPQNQLQIITFKDLGNGQTELTVTEKDWVMGKTYENAKQGMEESLTKLAQLLENKK